MRRRTRLIASAVTVALVALTAFAVTAGAQSGITKSHYPPFDTSSNANGTSGNYTGSSLKFGVTCLLAPLTCPNPNFSGQTSHGQGGSGGFLQIGFGQLIPADADILATWESQPFTYNGAQGKDPTQLSLSLFRKFHCDFPGVHGCALVDLTIGNEVRYTVDIIDATSGDVVAQPIENRLLRPNDFWTRSEASLDPDDLTRGHQYRIGIVTEVRTTAQVIPDPNTFVGYDTVDLKAVRNPADLPGGGGGGGGGGKTVFQHWHRLIVKDKCPKSLQGHSCLIRLVTFKSDYHGVHPTPHKTVRRRGHHLKRITLRVRPEFNDWARRLANSNGRLHVHERVQAHHKKISRNRTLPVVAFKKP